MEREQLLTDAVTAVCGAGVAILRKTPVSGGDINRAYLLSLSDGSFLFVTENSASNLDFFIKEAQGLAAIEATVAIRVPKVYGCGIDGHNAYLLMECVKEGRQAVDFYEDFGRKLAAMHAADCSEYTGEGRYGFTEDNYIGAGYQENTPETSWIGFFRKRRLLPQIKRAEHYFDREDRIQLDRLMEKLEDLLIEPEKPALLHGDLWSGNYMCGPEGHAWLIDPAVYVGHPEADLAMTELFGGFPRAFYQAYFEAAKLPHGYEDRRDIYNLYHLLNHLNLFGGTYYSAVMRIVGRYV